MPYWDERVEEMAKTIPKFTDKQHIDILCARFVLQPERFDVVVGSNLFGDISPISARPVPALSALRRRPISIRAQFPSLFELVHGRRYLR